MKIGLFTNCFPTQSWDEICAMARKCGIQHIEAGAGCFNGKAHCNPRELLNDKGKLKSFLETARRHEVEIAELSAMGNYLNPDGHAAEESVNDLCAAMELGSEIGVGTVNVLSGCPGAGEHDIAPNFIAFPYPPENLKYLQWQWDERVLPFWTKMTKRAKELGVRFALKMHPGFAVYNPDSFLRLRNTVGGDVIGCKFDATHLIWNGIDPVQAIYALEGTIISSHAQDCEINEMVMRTNGCFSSRPYDDPRNRPWNFRIIGYGHGEEYWRKTFTALRDTGFDGFVNIEHLDYTFSLEEGVARAAEFLNRTVFFQTPQKVNF
ncbi:MAG: sugar phosphate isomerase/epimerase [Oscillospiraceae bacterium]|nr:sugar phosphate isomerase/epimerase [Oscillospiraceae bacterium]